MGMIGEVGVQKKSSNPYGVSLWRTIRQGRPVFQNPFNSRLVLVIELNFGIMCGVGAVLSRRLFRNTITLVIVRSLLSQMLCTFLTRGFTGIFFFLKHPKIGK